MYLWLVFFHVLVAFAYILTAWSAGWFDVAVAREAEPERSLTLISAMPQLTMLRIILVLLLGTGLIIGFMVPW